MSIELHTVAWDDPDAVALRVAQRAEIDLRYGRPDSEPGPAPTAASVRAFVVASRDGVPLGCGGLRPIDATHGEVKRMFVDPAARGTGVSTAVLGELERIGRSWGWSRLVLETGTEQPDAIRFYEREGYLAIPCWSYYASNPESLCYEKAL